MIMKTYLLLVSLLIGSLGLAQTPAEPPVPATELRLNFQAAPVDTVLDYLSRAAGFVIVRDGPIEGTIDIVSHQPLNADEAVELLHAMLNQRGYALIRNGRILTIVKRDAARTLDLPVQSGSDPQALAKSGEIITQIVPLRHTNAAKLIETLRPLLPAQATISANADSNALVITDTQTNIRRMMEIVKALDTTISSILDIKVIALQYADAEETAAVINKVYETPARSANQSAASQRTQMFARMRGFGGGGEGGGEADAGDNEAKQTATYVKAVADQRGNAVVVTAPAEVIPQIQQLVMELDLPTEAITALRVFPLRFADATQVANVITGLYPSSTTGTARTQQTQPGGGRFPWARGGQAAAETATPTSERKVTESKVVAVADTRTNAVIVSASQGTMEDIADVVERLDATPANVPTVYIYRLQNADAARAKEIIDSMFDDLPGSSSSSTNRTTGTTGATGTTRPLTNTGTGTGTGTTNR